MDLPEFGPNDSPTFLDPSESLLFGGGVNYHMAGGLFVGVDASFARVEIESPAGGVVDMDTFFFSGLLGYTIPLHDRFDIYGLGGPTVALFAPTDHDSEPDLGGTYGVGARVYLAEQFAFNGGYRGTLIISALDGMRTDGVNEVLLGHSFFGGFSFFFGSGNSDSDEDGVKDRADACPDTPDGAEVDALGCAVDTDGDGVADYQDGCPNTPAEARVDSGGCPMDDDADRVFDGLDRCPGTPMGAEVDESGCPIDSDADRVFDGLDRCPDTPFGVDVDPNGCPVPEPEPVEPEPQPEVFTFRGTVSFGNGGTAISALAETALREIGELLVAHPGVLVTLEGYADSVGNDDVNLRVSQRRAVAVRNFLVGTFEELTTGQFTVLWYGEARPVADNSTAEGRAQNRRVVLKVGF